MDDLSGIHLVNYMTNLYDELAIILRTAKDNAHIIRLQDGTRKTVASYDQAARVLKKMGYRF